MDALLYRPGSSATEEQLTRALARQLGSMELATKITRAGLHEIATVHAHATDKVAQTLATARDMVKAASYAGRISPAKERELKYQTEDYLREMLGITYDTSGKIIDILGS